MATSFNGERNRREPPTMGKQVVNFITCGCESSAPFLINPAVSEANMVDTCKHFEIGSGSVRSLSHLSVFVIEHLCRAEGGTNTKQIQ
jgi:hypothetical protein